MFGIRTAVHENHMTLEELAAEGITEDSVTKSLQGASRGWVVERDGDVVGFSIANGEDRSVWALFVLPEYEGLGGGRKLLRAATSWLMDTGAGSIRLETAADTRAEGFYLHEGWERGEVNKQGDVEFTYGKDS